MLLPPTFRPSIIPSSLQQFPKNVITATEIWNKIQLEDLNNENQWGCDECFICYTSKFYADLHELEEHPDTSYVRDHIPTSTKLQFAAEVRWSYIL